jgi:hypothetical protein
MSQTRIFWIIWCSMWALGWLLLGFFTIITWLFVPLSLLAILLPVGKEGGGGRGPKQVHFGPGGPQIIQQPPAPSTPPPGWYPDPWNQQPMRWWDGHAWQGTPPHA